VDSVLSYVDLGLSNVYFTHLFHSSI